MTLTFRIGLPVLLSCSVLLFAQHLFGQDRNESPDQRVSPAATNSSAATPAQSHPVSQGPVDVLSDTRGVDFGPYLARVLTTIREHWGRVIPDVAKGPIAKRGTVLVGFRIMKDGAITDLHFVQSSGDRALDQAALEGIAQSNPFQPLPLKFPCQYVTLQYHFYYNPDRRDFDRAKQSSADPQVLPCVTSSIRVMEQMTIAISPASARVTVGASQQFSVATENATNLPVNWSLSGQGCAASECGSITANGLYTAPARVPNPPRVAVTAALPDYTVKTDSATVTIVPSTSTH
jgi:TonB family protein